MANNDFKKSSTFEAVTEHSTRNNTPVRRMLDFTTNQVQVQAQSEVHNSQYRHTLNSLHNQINPTSHINKITNPKNTALPSKPVVK